MTLHVIGTTLAGKMSVVERIKQTQEENARKNVVETALIFDATQKAEEQRIKAKVEREKFMESQYEKIIKESCVVDLLKQIETGILETKYKTHGIFLDYKYSELNVSLAWNYQATQLKEGKLSGYDYYSIRVGIDPFHEVITIDGKEFQSEEWHNDKNLIEECLVGAFLNPHRNTETFSFYGEPGSLGGLS